jgi:hypothetical protein
MGAPASAHTASVAGSFVCDRKTGEYVVTWTVSNDYKDVATLSKVTLAPDGATWTTELPTTVAAAVSKDEPSSVTGVVRLPGTATATSLSVHATWPDQYDKASAAALKLAGTCAPNEAKPAAEIVLTCEHATITLKNEGTAPATFRVYVKVDDGEFQQVPEVKVQPGDTEVLTEADLAPEQKTLIAAAADGNAPPRVITVKVVAKHMDDVVESIDFADCEQPSESPSPSPSITASPVVEQPPSSPPAVPPSGSLPVTGASVGGLAVGAMAALGVGIALTVLARRRKQS